MLEPLEFSLLRVKVTSLLLALTVVLGACGEPADDPTEDVLSAEERAYLDGVGSALRLFDERNDAFRRALGQTYQTNEALFSALHRAGAGTAFEPGLEALEALEPPARFVDDHEILLDRQRQLVLLDRDIGAAIAEVDIKRFILLNMRLGLTSQRTALELEPIVCRTLLENGFADHPTQSASYLAAVFCDRSELPGQGYGDDVRQILRTMTIEVSHRGNALGFFDLVPVVPDEVFLRVAGEAFTELVESVRTATQGIRSLEPPARMAHDQAELLAYLDEVERIMDRLIQAVQDGDVDAFESNAFADLYCRTRDSVGFAYRPIVRVHFSDAFGFCPGAGEF